MMAAACDALEGAATEPSRLDSLLANPSHNGAELHTAAYCKSEGDGEDWKFLYGKLIKERQGKIMAVMRHGEDAIAASRGTHVKLVVAR